MSRQLATVSPKALTLLILAALLLLTTITTFAAAQEEETTWAVIVQPSDGATDIPIGEEDVVIPAEAPINAPPNVIEQLTTQEDIPFGVIAADVTETVGSPSPTPASTTRKPDCCTGGVSAQSVATALGAFVLASVIALYA